MNSLSFFSFLVRKVCIPLISEGPLKHSSLFWHFSFFFSIFWTCQFLLTWKVSAEKFTESLMKIHLFVTPLFTLATFKIFPPCSVAKSCGHFATPWTAEHQASLSLTIFQSLPKFTSIALVMPSKHLILCHFFALNVFVWNFVHVLLTPSNVSLECDRQCSRQLCAGEENIPITHMPCFAAPSPGVDSLL